MGGNVKMSGWKMLVRKGWKAAFRVQAGNMGVASSLPRGSVAEGAGFYL